MDDDLFCGLCGVNFPRLGGTYSRRSVDRLSKPMSPEKLTGKFICLNCFGKHERDPSPPRQLKHPKIAEKRRLKLIEKHGKIPEKRRREFCDWKKYTKADKYCGLCGSDFPIKPSGKGYNRKNASLLERHVSPERLAGKFLCYSCYGCEERGERVVPTWNRVQREQHLGQNAKMETNDEYEVLELQELEHDDHSYWTKASIKGESLDDDDDDKPFQEDLQPMKAETAPLCKKVPVLKTAGAKSVKVVKAPQRKIVRRPDPVVVPIVSGVSMSTSNDGATLNEMVRSFIPDMTFDQHKGQNGRIAVVGGSDECTGAPYFAALSALKVGADLSYVLCTADAAPVIRTYCPELMVNPILDKADNGLPLTQLILRMHTLVVGPGLGRDKKIFNMFKIILRVAKSRHIPLVIDSDGLYFLTMEPDLIRGYTQAILTPNAAEFERLFRLVVGRVPLLSNAENETRILSEALDFVTIVRKGAEDIISNGQHVLIGNAEGSPRRCGGQGDLLAGFMGVFSHWAHTSSASNDNLDQLGAPMAAAYAASCLTRECSRMAFSQQSRSMTTTDMISQIHDAFEGLYGPDLTP